MEAVRKLTSLPADSVQLRDRGSLQPGMAADLVVFDLDDLRDNSTNEVPQAYPSGIEIVMVNGEIAFERGKLRSGCRGSWCGFSTHIWTDHSRKEGNAEFRAASLGWLAGSLPQGVYRDIRTVARGRIDS